MTRDGIGFTRLWLATCVVGLVGGALLVATDHTAEGHFLWGVTTVIGGIPVTIDVIRSLSRREAGVDLIAILAILGCLGLHEYAAGAVIAVMLASGQTLEDYADRRAHRELSDLLARAPRQVHRYEDGELQTREIDDVVLGDRLFVKSGEVVPVDGVLEGDAVLDESALHGRVPPGRATRAAIWCARARSTRARPSTCMRPRRRPTARTPASCGWSRRRRRRRRRPCAWPIGTRSGSSRSRW